MRGSQCGHTVWGRKKEKTEHQQQPGIVQSFCHDPTTFNIARRKPGAKKPQVMGRFRKNR